MKTHAALFLAFMLAATLSAQTVPPALMVKENGVSTPLGLAAVRTEVRIFGSVAETTMTMTFANPTGRVLEGDLYFPLPEGATISGYALDINGAMIDGVAVEKHEARQVYEAVVRQGIDPGLVQWTAGNNFQTRVFPIPPNGTRTVRVQYVTELTGGREAPAYHLPLKFKSKIGEFSLRVEVVKAAAPPQVTKGELTNFAFQQWRDSYVAETKQQNWTPVEDLVIALPKTEGPQVLVEKADDGQTYFAIQDYPAQKVVEDQITAIPKRVVVFWDASGSRSGDHKREIAVLRGYLGAFMPKGPMAGEMLPISVDLVLLRNVLGKPVRMTVSLDDLSALTAALESVQYDGGTQLGAIEPIPGAEKPDFYLLFTDGISNFGSEEPARLDAPLYIFSADAGANHALLHSLSMSNGGRYFNLANWKDVDIFAQAGKPAWSFLAAKIDGGEAADLYPQRPQPLGGRFTLVGKLTGETATVTADYGIAGGQARQTDLQGLALRGSQRLALAAALGGQETGRADDPPEAERARDRRLGQEVQPGHALHVALGARLAGAIRPLRHRPAQVAARDAGRVHAADRHHRAPEAEGEGRQGRTGGPHVAGAGQLVDQRVQVSQGF